MKKTTKKVTVNKKVLVIDDNEGILDAITLILEDEGYIVETISNGNETIERTKIFQPDIIILDVLLSGSDGRYICRRLKNEPDTKHIPVVMISAHPNIEKSITDSGADGFLSKPFDAAQLLTIIKKMLNS